MRAEAEGACTYVAQHWPSTWIGFWQAGSSQALCSRRIQPSSQKNIMHGSSLDQVAPLRCLPPSESKQ